MANVKISQLPAATSLAGDTLLEVVQNGENKKATLNAIQTLTAESITAQRTALSINNVDNTSDANKPVSTAQQTALDGKAATSHTHTAAQISDSTTAGRALLTAADASAQRTALSINNVDNTSDANKPVSTAQQTALNGKANTSHSHSIADVTGLQTALDGKAATSHSHSIADVTGLQTALDGKAATSHSHAIADVTGLQPALDGKAATSHSHAITDVTNLQPTLDGKADATRLTFGSSQVYDTKTLDASDAGRMIFFTNTFTMNTLTIPSGGVFSTRQFCMLHAGPSGLTITPDGGVTLRVAGTALNGSYVLGPYGVAFLMRHPIATDQYYVWPSLGSADSPTFTAVSDSKGNLRDLPVTNRTAAYTAALSDTGGTIRISSGGVTIPSGVFSAGQAFSIANNSASNQTITQGAGVTLRLAGTATTGNRTLAQYGLCTVTCVASNEFFISGPGLT